MSAASKPTLFVVAITFLWLALALSLMEILTNTNHVVIPVPLATVFALFALVFVVKAFFVYKIFKQRNWARIVYLCVMVLGGIRVVAESIPEIARTPLSGLIGFAPVALQIAAICLLFTPACNALFKKPAQLA
jgi:hypothetical protein